MGTHTWNKDRATKRIDARIDALPLKDIEIKDYVRDTDLSNLSNTVAYRIDAVHLYADILNLKDMLHVTDIEGETCHKRTLRFLNLHYRAVHRIVGRVDAMLVDFHNQRLHSVFAKPYDNEAKRVHRAVATGQLVIDVLARTGEDADHPAAKVRIGIDSGKAFAVNNGRRGHREPLFLGEPANQAAKRAAGGAATGIYLTNKARGAIGLKEAANTDTTPLSGAEIAASQKAANLGVTPDQIVNEWTADLKSNPIGKFEFKGHTPPFATLDIQDLSVTNSRRQDAATVYGDLDGFTAYVRRNIATEDGAKHVVRTLHVLRAELDAVLHEDFEGRKVRFIGDCVHGLLVEGTAQTTEVQETISNMTLCAGAMRSSFDVALTVPVRAPLTGSLISAHHKESTVYVINKVTQADGTSWLDQGIPAQFGEEYYQRPVTILRIEPGTALPPTTSLQEFRATSFALGLNAEQNHVILLQGANVHSYFLWEADSTVTEIAVVPAQSEAQRLDSSHEILKTRHIALIGCGSLGSKLGTMLARSGCGRFLLVDDDLLLQDNFVRNDLDWRDIGTHKAQAVARRLQLVNPDVETLAWRLRLAGQESSDSAETALNKIGECDLIFDATGNPDIINLVSAVAASTTRPVMWAEVFGGGIGGLIARCRPGIEPPPQYMRRAIENWFGERIPPPIRSTRPYETGQDGIPLIANDADVSVIAAHAARFAIDTLIAGPSLFPYSVYAIGLGVGSVFTQPFEIFPIEVGPPLPAESNEELSSDAAAGEIATIIELFRARANETAAAPEDNQTCQA